MRRDMVEHLDTQATLQERKRLIDSLVRGGYIHSGRVVRTMLKVPRHVFIPHSLEREAYYDCPLEIGEGQTISAPHMVGIMCETLDLREGQSVLEIGSGSGYHAAVVAEIIRPGHVYSVERFASLAKRARENIAKCLLSDVVTIIVGDGSKGLAEHAPYDRIFVTAASPGIPEPLVSQLKDGGKLLVPVGGRFYQDLIAVVKKGDRLIKENHGGCVFVPLIGEHGF